MYIQSDYNFLMYIGPLYSKITLIKFVTNRFLRYDFKDFIFSEVASHLSLETSDTRIFNNNF